MDEREVRAAVQALVDALVAGDVEGATAYLSDELKRNLGEVVALLPLPATDATIESVERTASAFVVVVRVAGETQEDQLQTRWKDRDGEPRIVELSHLSRVERPVAASEADAGDNDEDGTGPSQPAA